MKLNANDFRVHSGRKVTLSKWPTTVEPICTSDVEYDDLLEMCIRDRSSHWRLVTSKTACRRFETVSSGPKTRKLRLS